MMNHLPELQLIRAWMTTAISETRRRPRDERGEIAQTVIIVAILAAAAIVVATIIATKFTDKARSISTE